ncbi:MAG: hypothetical protein SPI71_02340 [Acidaminococcaceae bacterium]|nr:hypothetical protein [Acidaminococcaceae bacterium]
MEAELETAPYTYSGYIHSAQDNFCNLFTPGGEAKGVEFPALKLRMSNRVTWFV